MKVLRGIGVFITDRHFAETVADFKLEFWQQIRLHCEQIGRLAILHPCFVDRLVAIVKLLQPEQIRRNHVIDIKCPEVARSEVLPTWRDRPVG